MKKNPYSPSKRRLVKIKRRISGILSGRKKSLRMNLYLGDLFNTFEGQPTLSQYYIVARIIEADLVRREIYDKSYGEFIARAARGMENSKEKTIHTMKMYRGFLEHLDEVGFNPDLGCLSVASSADGIFADDGTHRLGWLYWAGIKYVSVSLDDRAPKYPLKGREELKKGGIDETVLSELDRAFEEIRKGLHGELLVILRDSVAGEIPALLSGKGQLEKITLSNSSVNEKVRENEIPEEIWRLYYDYKDCPCHIYTLKLPENRLWLRDGKLHSVAVEEITKEIDRLTGTKSWGYIANSVTESLGLRECLSRLEHDYWE